MPHVPSLFLLLGLSLLLSCEKEPVVLDYCAMIAADQSHVNWDKSNPDQYAADRAQRGAIVQRNFERLVAKTEESGFPAADMITATLDSCQYWAVTMTMIHEAQLYPEVFYSPRYAKLFREQMDLGFLKRKLLRQSTQMAVANAELCRSVRPTMESALDRWEVERSVLNNARFRDCE